MLVHGMRPDSLGNAGDVLERTRLAMTGCENRSTQIGNKTVLGRQRPRLDLQFR